MVMVMISVGPCTSVVIWVKIIGTYHNRGLLINSIKYDDDDVCVWYYSLPCTIVYLGVSSLFIVVFRVHRRRNNIVAWDHATGVWCNIIVISFWRWRFECISVVYIDRLTARYYCWFVIIYGLPNSFSFLLCFDFDKFVWKEKKITKLVLRLQQVYTSV